jgi:hypothetical protein
MEELQKNRKRAVRRKRNLIAKDLRMNKLYAPKVVELKRVRKRLSVREVYDEDWIDDPPIMRKEA